MDPESGRNQQETLISAHQFMQMNRIKMCVTKYKYFGSFFVFAFLDSPFCYDKTFVSLLFKIRLRAYELDPWISSNYQKITCKRNATRTTEWVAMVSMRARAKLWLVVDTVTFRLELFQSSRITESMDAK